MFSIQLGHPKVKVLPVLEFKSIRSVFTSLFRECEESSYLFWNGAPIRLRYREDLHLNFDNLLAMAWLLQDRHEGRTIVTLKNRILEAQLELSWHDDSLLVEGFFVEQSHVYKAFCDSLNKKSKLKISRHAFLKEWHTLLHQISVSLDAGGIEITDGTERRKLEMLQRVNQSINGFGVLYERVISQ